jgi:hypothetical protein
MEAVDRAIGLVLAHKGTVFSPLLANAVKLERAYVLLARNELCRLGLVGSQGAVA